jgi:hypothetical protein
MRVATAHPTIDAAAVAAASTKPQAALLLSASAKSINVNLPTFG